MYVKIASDDRNAVVAFSHAIMSPKEIPIRGLS